MKRSLTATAVTNAKPKEKPYKLADGGGLYLFVTSSGTKTWRYKYRLHGKEGTFTLGSYPALSLAKARTEHDAARALVEAHVDPGNERRATIQKRISEATTFECVARDYMLKKTTKGDPAQRWSKGYATKVERIFRREVFPKIGAMQISAIGAAELGPIIEAVAERKTVKMPHHKKARPHERGATSTAIHIRQLCRAVFSHAAAKGLARYDYDPTWGLRNVVSKPAVKHHTHLQLEELPDLWARLAEASGTEAVKIAVELLALTFVRTGELRLAEWAEFETEGGGKLGPHWRIPAQKTKKRREHLVPLTPRSIELLGELKKITGESRFLFPSRTQPDGAMNANTINHTLYRMGYQGKFSGHGFRGTASTALHESGFAPHVIEAQLAHWGKQDKTAASYNHAQYWSERMELMRHWAGMLYATPSNVLQFRSRIV